MQSVVQCRKSVHEFKSGPERATQWARHRFLYHLFLFLLGFCSSFFLCKRLQLHIWLQIKPCGIVWGWAWQERIRHIPTKTRVVWGSLPVLCACILQLAAMSCEISNPDTVSNPTKPSVLFGPGRREGTCSQAQGVVDRLGASSWAGRSMLCECL